MAERKDLPTVDYLQECFDVVNGKLVWKIRPKQHFATQRGWKSFNKQNAGKMCSGRLVKEARYLVVRLAGYGILKQHRIILSLYLGRSLRKDEIVDHIDGNTLNNDESNLRVCNYSQNSRNTKLSTTSSTLVHGVYRLVNSQDGHEFYRAQWTDDKGLRKNKSFSISKYGESKAFELSCAERKTQIEKLGDYIERI